MNVSVFSAPISERYWSRGDIGLIIGNRIRLGGCWFPFDSRYIIIDLPRCKAVETTCGYRTFDAKCCSEEDKCKLKEIK